MKSPQLTWFIKENEQFIPKKEHYAGSYSRNETLSLEMQVWNNRWGVEDVEDLDDPMICLYFDTVEDSSLLEFCRIIINGTDEVPLIIRNKKATAFINRALSGKANNGDDRNPNNQNNFVNITFEFNAGDHKLKEDDLKSLYFEITSVK